MTATLDEKAIRRPEWDESRGRWVTLADGQEWLLKSPVIELYPKFVDGKATLAMASDLGPEFDALVENFDGEIVAVFEIAAALLRPHYTLTDEELGTLLRWRRNDEASTARVDAIMGAATGRDVPKPMPAGSDAAFSS